MVGWKELPGQGLLTESPLNVVVTVWGAFSVCQGQAVRVRMDRSP